MKAKRKLVWSRIGSFVMLMIAWLLVGIQMIAFNYVRGIGAVVLALLLGVCAIVYFKGKKEPSADKKLMIVKEVLICAVIICEIINMVICRYQPACILAFISFALILAIMCIMIIEGRKAAERNPIVLGVIGYVLAVIVVMITVIPARMYLNPDGFSVASRSVGGDFVSGETSVTQKEGYTFYQNLVYPSAYGCNTLDVMDVADEKGTIFYVHGGGFAVGDKEQRTEYLLTFVQEGYDIVNIDYELAPEVRYPACITQVNEALKFVLENAEEYGINAEHMVFMGDSAGGQLTGQLVNLMTNSEYASSMGITPANSGTDFKPAGYISIGGLTDMPRFGQTGFFLVDWVFNLWGVTYFDNQAYELSAQAEEASVLAHVTSDFPMAFISDGNIGTFTEHNKDLAAKLESLGVDVTSVFFDRSETTQIHIFELHPETEYGQKVHEAHLAYLERVCGE